MTSNPAAPGNVALVVDADVGAGVDVGVGVDVDVGAIIHIGAHLVMVMLAKRLIVIILECG